jgi:hypothetical protein
MKTFIFALLSMLFVTNVTAHEMVPTYPSLRPSYVEGVYTTTIVLFNKRKDVEYYEISVMTEDWERIPFASASRVINLKYLDHATVEIYIKKEDVKRAVYICSESKLRRDGVSRTVISTKICSKFK